MTVRSAARLVERVLLKCPVLTRRPLQELRQGLDYGTADMQLQRAVSAFSRAVDVSGGADVKALGNLGNALLALVGVVGGC